MKRFMKFSDIIELVKSGTIQPGLIIKGVASEQTLLLNQFTLANSTYQTLAFCDEERNIIQTISPDAVFELVNITFEGE